ncbi:hypothetical protein A2U01_0061297, partial [Trifolium medium]|nr:hypothetical protein [Trifolium medium]
MGSVLVLWSSAD